MGAVLSLDGLLDARRVWRGSSTPAQVPADAVPTGCAALDAAMSPIRTELPAAPSVT